ncbi:MAG TPA: carboxypeptidase regulatory-like domain-containing protein, partial [Planctomycetota bacterium]|nr:carboxypeptidase regulatory-like domain-containing protein [Planctomycetota bacterium]
MTSLRAIAAALAVVCAVAFVALWPRDAEVVQWTVADVETNAPQDEAADVTAPDAQRSVVEPDPTAASEADREELQARTITVRGRVVDRFGGPIAGAAVHVELRGGGSERVRRPVTTAADGTFALRGPMRLPRTVRVRASHPEHAPSVVDRPVSEVSDEVVLGDIVLGGGARVRGQVVRGDGSAVAGATVELQPDGATRMAWSLDGTRHVTATETDGTGSFELTHVPAGSFFVVARATRMLPARTDSFAVSEGDEEVLAPLVLQPGAMLTGVVVDRAGRPIAKATVYATTAGQPAAQHHATTGDDGRFAIDYLRTAPTSVLARAQGYVSVRQRLDLAVQSDVTIVLEQGLVLRGTVRDESGRPITAFAVRARRMHDLAEPVAAELAGRSPAELNAEIRKLTQALSERGNDPATVARIAELQHAASQLSLQQRTASAGEQIPQDPGAIVPHPGGEFTLTGLDEGVYAVDVKAEDYQMTRSEAVELRVGQPAPSLTVILQRGVEVHGEVVRETDGRGIAGARVELMRLSEQRPGLRVRGPTIARAIAGPDGTFILRNVRPGTVALRVQAPGYEGEVGPPFVAGHEPARQRIALRPLAALHGRVRRVPPGREREVTVTVFSASRSVATRTLADDGTYRFTDLQPGDYRVAAFLCDARAAVRRMNALVRNTPGVDVVLAAGEERAHDLDLSVVPLGALRGTVRINGAAAGGFVVTLSRVEPGNGAQHATTLHEARVEADGTFALRDLDTGPHVLRVLSIARERVELAQREVVIAADEEHTIAIDVVSCELTGEVTFA